METSDKLAFFALGISIMTAIFSWYSFSKTNELSKNAFNRNYRPYVSALNFSYIDDDNLMTPDMNTLLIRILNAPAFVTSKKLTFYTRDNNGDSLFFEHPEYKNELLYPLDNTQNTMGTGNKIISQEICEKILPKKLIRKFRIEYEWISDSSLKYYFESEWEYSVVKRNWQIVSQTAN